jgi:hypothetical protein
MRKGAASLRKDDIEESGIKPNIASTSSTMVNVAEPPDKRHRWILPRSRVEKI